VEAGIHLNPNRYRLKLNAHRESLWACDPADGMRVRTLGKQRSLG